MARDDYKSAIKKLLKAQRRPLSTRKIAFKTDMTWPTAKKYLGSLKKSGELSSYRSNNKIFWKPVKVGSYNRTTRSGRKTKVRTYRRKKPRKSKKYWG